jgi:hypothetical protein
MTAWQRWRDQTNGRVIVVPVAGLLHDLVSKAPNFIRVDDDPMPVREGNEDGISAGKRRPGRPRKNA